MGKKIFIIMLIIVMVFIYSDSKDEIIIPNTAIRLRVIPNSNDMEDIYIKEEVLNYLENDVYLLTKDALSIDEAREIINNNILSVKENIDDIFVRNNYDVSYVVNYGNNYFPQKEYYGVVYPEGYYESLVISIGDASGDNFWCVLFPNFCLVDNNDSYVYKSYFRELLNKIF